MFNEMKVFSATKAKDRDELGDKVTAFLHSFKGQVVDCKILQSSDNEFHCLTIVLFLKR